MKIVLDTSVLIAAFYQPLRGPSFSKEVFDYAVEEETVFLSTDILAEFQQKCMTKLKLPDSLIESMIALLQHRTQTITPSSIDFAGVSSSLRDPNDRHVLALVATVHADLLLTWDKDLLVLKKSGTATILTPRQFWNTLS